MENSGAVCAARESDLPSDGDGMLAFVRYIPRLPQGYAALARVR